LNKSAAMTNTQMEIVKLKQGEQYVVRLKGLAMSGFEWVYENSNEKTAGVQKTFLNDDSIKTVGASAMEIFTLTALQKGEATLHFSQVRQWEPGKAPREEKLLKLLVD
ncbi:MAG TPA: protease inhibitor I42 family protein, partial [Chitinophagaceae bacterium]|nr:protease inhibitor I42 family protein [Chitinophagaceae bacterium]